MINSYLKTRKIIITLFFLLPLFTSTQTFKSYGLSIGTTLHESGWSNPDTFSYYYHDKVYISSINMGIYGEFLSFSNASTMIDLQLKVRQYFFEYDLGSPEDAKEVENNLYFITLGITEKLRVDFDRWSIYGFGGVRFDTRISSSIEKDFPDVFAESKPFLIGTTAGVGFSKRVSRFWRVSFDFFYDYDLVKMYESPNGYIRNQGFGVKVGFGPFNPKKK